MCKLIFFDEFWEFGATIPSNIFLHLIFLFSSWQFSYTCLEYLLLSHILPNSCYFFNFFPPYSSDLNISWLFKSGPLIIALKTCYQKMDTHAAFICGRERNIKQSTPKQNKQTNVCVCLCIICLKVLKYNIWTHFKSISALAIF